MDTIFNFHQYNNLLASGGQPTEEQLEKIKEAGFERIINLSPASTPNYLATETSTAEQLGLSYIHYPVDCSNLRPEHFTFFRSIMSNSKDVKTFVHCGGNIKSSNLIHMYQVLDENRDETSSLNELSEIQKPEEKWFGYFKLFGMNGEL